MKTSQPILFRVILIALVVVGMTGRVFGQAQQAVPPPSAPAQLSEADLEKLAAPIALYPDPLLAVMLPASVYPLEIVQAARFIQNTNNLAQLDSQPWDDNVKAVARFPDVIQKMNDDLQWTINLGNAFADQPMDLMNAIQTLRAKAQAAGTLQSSPQQVVVVTNAVVERYYESQIVYVTNTTIEIQPANPQYIYVPYYNPVYVYYPPPYVYPYPYITFSAGFTMGVYISHHRCDWYYGGVYVGRSGVVVWGGRGPYHPPYYPRPPGCHYPPYYRPGGPGYYPPPPSTRPPGYPDNRPPGSGRPGGGGPPTTLPADAAKRWQPDPNRRQNAGAPSAGNRPAQGWGSRPSTQPAPGNGAPGSRPGTLPGNGNNGNAGNIPGARPMPAPAPGNNQSPANRPAQAGGSQNSAFGGVSNGSAARTSSYRGAASRGGGGRGGGGRR
jgi:Protein of unknown function (DUF3300)